ncbi:hypothetical protein Trydic_g515 [Trypoxylus dichotomus]
MNSGRERYTPGISPNIEVQLYRTYVQKEDINVREWPQKWGCILDEYKELYEKLGKITEKSFFISRKTPRDPRSAAPLPNSVNHEYGWLASKPEFKLEIYGPDVVKFKIPDIYQSF